MSIYLKKFETQSAYEAAQPNLILPNVSLTVDNNTVHYNPSSPIPPTPDGHLYAKVYDEYGNIAICDSLGKLVWFDVNGEKGILGTSQNEEQVIEGKASYWLGTIGEISIEEYEPNPIASATDIQDVDGMTILGSLATSLGYSGEYEVVFDPKETLLTE